MRLFYSKKCVEPLLYLCFDTVQFEVLEVFGFEYCKYLEVLDVQKELIMQFYPTNLFGGSGIIWQFD
jgi:hypothetical protein